ncbi:MAG: hypothetical protein HYU57_00780 [Micavibrio aeruginosavorus]|nr:hypothetical protein [Micavibrio aeruginosavorus]
MKFFFILTIALLPQAANAAEIQMPVRVKIVRMVTVEERKAACAAGYSLACSLLESDEQSPDPDRSTPSRQDNKISRR